MYDHSSAATFHREQSSDEIGKGVPGAAVRTTAASASRSTTAATTTIASSATAARATPNHAPAVDPDAYLQGYRHQAKVEHPLYTTR